MSEPEIVAIGADAGSTTCKLVAVGRGGEVLGSRLEATQPDLEIPQWPYRTAMADVAQRHDVLLVDAVAAFRVSGAPDGLFMDVVHPSPLGASLLAQLLDSGIPAVH